MALWWNLPAQLCDFLGLVSSQRTRAKVDSWTHSRMAWQRDKNKCVQSGGNSN